MFHRFVLTATAFAALLPAAALAEPAAPNTDVLIGVAVGSASGPESRALITDMPTARDFGSRPDARWGEPLGADLVNTHKARLGVRYFGEAGANGTTQAVGVKLTIPQ